MSNPPQDKCSGCQHPFSLHFTAYGGLMGCATGTRVIVRTYTQFDNDEVIAKCLCQGYATVIPRDSSGKEVRH